MNLFKTKGGRLLVFLMATALIFVFGACEWTDLAKDKDPEEGSSGVDFTSYDSNYAILVRNETNKRLVAFKGSLTDNTMLGGIPAGGTHALKKDPALFTKNEDFAMILLTEEQYNANKSNLRPLENTPFTRVYVFYNHTGENNNHYVISSRVGGIYKLTIQNPTSYNVELRLGGIGGETIGYATKDMLTTTLYVDEGDFNIFPVFKRYNSLRDTVETLYPKMSNGYSWFMPLGFQDIPGAREQTFSVKTAVDSLSSSTSGVAWLAINNQTGSGAIHLMKGTEVVRTTAGVSYFTGIKTFQIDMPVTTTGNNTTFASSMVIANYVLGPDGFEVPIEDESGSRNITLKVDMMYTVTVSGSMYDQAGLKAVIIVDDEAEGGPEAVEAF